MNVNSAAESIHQKLALAKATESGQIPNVPVNVMSKKAFNEKLAQVADEFNRQNGTNIPLSKPTIKEKVKNIAKKAADSAKEMGKNAAIKAKEVGKNAANAAKKAGEFLKTNKKAVIITTAITAGVSLLAAVASSIEKNKSE